MQHTAGNAWAKAWKKRKKARPKKVARGAAVAGVALEVRSGEDKDGGTARRDPKSFETSRGLVLSKRLCSHQICELERSQPPTDLGSTVWRDLHWTG